MCPATVSGIVTDDAPVSNFSHVPSNSPKCLCESQLGPGSFNFVANRPLLSSKTPHFQNEAKYTTFLVRMSFICTRMKKIFSISKAVRHGNLLDTEIGAFCPYNVSCNVLAL